MLCHSREGRTAVAPNEDNLDVFSERRDPNALKVCGKNVIGINFISLESRRVRLSLSIFCFYFLKKQEHLLKMATEHRAEMAVKRGKAARVEEGL